MSRRKWFLLTGLLAACAISLGVVVPPYLPSPVQAEVDELRSCVDLCEEEPSSNTEVDEDELRVDESRFILVAIRIFAFDSARARTTIFADRERKGQPMRGIVKDDARFRTSLQDLDGAGYLNVLCRHTLVAFDHHTAKVYFGTPLGTQWRGVNLHVRPIAHGDGRKELHFDVKINDGATERPQEFKLKSTVVVEDGQTCFFGGLTRKAWTTAPWIPGTSDWPTIGAWRREVENNEEILIAVTWRPATLESGFEKLVADMEAIP